MKKIPPTPPLKLDLKKYRQYIIERMSSVAEASTRSNVTAEQREYYDRVFNLTLSILIETHQEFYRNKKSRKPPLTETMKSKKQ